MAANIRVRNSGVPNFMGERILVQSKFNLPLLDKLLKDYQDRRVLEFLMFGFPIDHDGSPVSVMKQNHTGAGPQFVNEIQEYLKFDIEQGAVLGPLRQNPFPEPIAVSPLNSVPKRDSGKRRIVLDLSFPEGFSVNDGIRADSYLGEVSKLTFPSIDDLVKIIHRKGPACLLFKRDLSRAYRQLPADVGNIHLLAYYFQDNYYYDLALPMGLRSSARCCQMVTDCIVYIFSQYDFHAVNYIDDLGGAEAADRAWDAFHRLGTIIRDIGMTEASDKSSPPSHTMIFLGLEVNTLDMTIRIPEEKFKEIQQELRKWKVGILVSRKDVQRLTGLLNFAAGCIKPGRIYFSRILNFLREMKPQEWVNSELFQDIKWWQNCAAKFNGISLIMNPKWENPDSTFSSDSSLVGCGAWFDGWFFHHKFTEKQKQLFTDINLLECVTVLAAVRLWGECFGRLNVVIKCDNENSVWSINSGISRNRTMQAILRNLHWECAKYSISIKAVHLRSHENRISDCLSRWFMGKSHREEFWRLTKGFEKRCYKVNAALFKLKDI